MPNYRFSDAKRTPSDSQASFPSDLDVAKEGDVVLVSPIQGAGAQPSTGRVFQWRSDGAYKVTAVGVLAGTPGNGAGNIIGDCNVGGTSAFAATADRPSQTANTASADQGVEAVTTAAAAVAKGDIVTLDLDDNGAAGTRSVSVWARLSRQV